MSDNIVHLPSVIADLAGTSRSEARRLVAQGGVRLDERTLSADDMDINAADLADRKLHVGKRRSYQL